MKRPKILSSSDKGKTVKLLANGLLVFFPCAIFYLELIFRLFIYKNVLSSGVVFSALFAITAGLVLYIIATIFNERANFIICWVIMLLLPLLYGMQFVYYQFFKTPISLYSVGDVWQVTQFLPSIISTTFRNIIPLLLMLVPFLLIITWGKHQFSFLRTPLRLKGLITMLCVASYFISLLALFISGKDVNSAYTLYFRSNVPDLAQPALGVLTNTRLDFQRLIFGFNPNEYEDEDNLSTLGGNSDSSGNNTSDKQSDSKPPKIYESNIMQIDFDNLIANEKNDALLVMHKYFSSVNPTLKNEYTGLFKDCNLIFITAESFSHFLINKDVCPTLYNLANEGITFTNFYNPIWGVSTSDGEYVACTGLIPKSGIWSFYHSGSIYMPFCMGNQFAKIGYPKPLAYHDHTYTYYKRNISHPNMGYDYKGVGNGLEVRKTWPESDVEMMELTIPTYINKERFHTYYMSVSGHMSYTFSGNFQADKHKSEVQNLDLPDECKAYLACNIEFDRAMKYLLQKLDEAGKLDNTVIVISADHYPYGLSKKGIDALAGHTVEENFELYKSSLIIWKKGLPTKIIDQPTSSLDIIPTISNLFGLEYDSRLLMGRDILSDSDPLVIFSNRSWITDKALYNSKTGDVKNLTSKAVTDEYVRGIKKLVSDKFEYSAKILDNDYYGKILK